jgi:hypothetical protein
MVSIGLVREGYNSIFNAILAKYVYILFYLTPELSS